MTGVDHYLSAERWLFKAENKGARGASETTESCAAIAQVHAALALAAATALAHQGEGRTLLSDDRNAWVAAASEVPGANRRRREAEAAEAAEFTEPQS